MLRIYNVHKNPVRVKNKIINYDSYEDFDTDFDDPELFELRSKGLIKIAIIDTENNNKSTLINKRRRK